MRPDLTLEITVTVRSDSRRFTRAPRRAAGPIIRVIAIGTVFQVPQASIIASAIGNLALSFLRLCLMEYKFLDYRPAILFLNLHTLAKWDKKSSRH